MVTAQSNAIDNLENYLKSFIEQKNLVELRARHEQGVNNEQRQRQRRV
jgi:hypothetical protein